MVIGFYQINPKIIYTNIHYNKLKRKEEEERKKLLSNSIFVYWTFIIINKRYVPDETRRKQKIKI